MPLLCLFLHQIPVICAVFFHVLGTIFYIDRGCILTSRIDFRTDISLVFKTSLHTALPTLRFESSQLIKTKTTIKHKLLVGDKTNQKPILSRRFVHQIIMRDRVLSILYNFWVVYTIVCKLILEKEKKRCILQLICFD